MRPQFRQGGSTGQRFRQHRRTRVGANKLAVSCHGCQTVWVLRINLNRYASRVVGLHKTPLQPFPTPHSSSLNGWEPAVELQKPCYTKSSSWSPGIWSCTSMHCASATIPIARCTASAGEHMWEIPHLYILHPMVLIHYRSLPWGVNLRLPCFNKVVCSNGAAQRLPYHAPVLRLGSGGVSSLPSGSGVKDLPTSSSTCA